MWLWDFRNLRSKKKKKSFNLKALLWILTESYLTQCVVLWTCELNGNLTVTSATSRPLTDTFVLQLGISDVRFENELFPNRIFLMNHFNEPDWIGSKLSPSRHLETHWIENLLLRVYSFPNRRGAQTGTKEYEAWLWLLEQSQYNFNYNVKL